MKEELEPVQALMTGNDVIFISSEDFASGDNPMKLINQLESKHIIFDGGSAKKIIEKWLSEGNQGRTDVSERIEKLSPEQAFLRSAMLQLQMHYGELKDFYKNYSGDESYREMLKSLFDQYQILKAQSEELNKRIRNLQYKDSRRSDDKKLHTAEIDGMMNQLRDINNQIKGKENASYHSQSGICFETQNFPDAPNHPNFPSAILLPGDIYFHKTIYKFQSF
jgi:hypothetical protein